MRTILSFWATCFNFCLFSKTFLSVQTEQKTDYGQLDLNSQIKETKWKTENVFLILIFWQFYSANLWLALRFHSYCGSYKVLLYPASSVGQVCMAWKGLSDPLRCFIDALRRWIILKLHIKLEIMNIFCRGPSVMYFEVRITKSSSVFVCLAFFKRKERLGRRRCGNNLAELGR